VRPYDLAIEYKLTLLNWEIKKVYLSRFHNNLKQLMHEEHTNPKIKAAPIINPKFH
jgi:hypothetical protein